MKLALHFKIGQGRNSAKIFKKKKKKTVPVSDAHGVSLH
jgi:hypothetical protein